MKIVARRSSGPHVEGIEPVQGPGEKEVWGYGSPIVGLGTEAASERTDRVRTSFPETPGSRAIPR